MCVGIRMYSRSIWRARAVSRMMAVPRRQSSTRAAASAGWRFASPRAGVAALLGALGLGGYWFYSQSPTRQVFPEQSTTPLTTLEPPVYGGEKELKLAVLEIQMAIGKENVTAQEAELKHHTDNQLNYTRPNKDYKPRYVIYPRSTKDVSAIMRIAHKYSIPVVPYSGGTSLEGHWYSTRCGIVLDTSRMDKILRVSPDDLDVTVQAGVGWKQLNAYLQGQPGLEHLIFGCDCGPTAHICGMINTNASGMKATKFGPMKMNVISVTAVLADGTVIKTGRRPRKTSAGYNLTGLLVGSEGTLAVITEATLKLQVKSPSETVAVVQFPTLTSCTKTVSELFKRGFQLNAIELLDSHMMKLVNLSKTVSKEYKETPTLFIKVGGINKTVVKEYVKELRSVCDMYKASSFEFARSDAEAEELFTARSNALYTMLDYCYTDIHEDAKIWFTDVAVPLSRLASTLEEIDRLCDKYPMKHAMVGHIGEGNFHYNLMYRPEELEMSKEVVSKMVDIGLRNEGTCTGEHGIGLGKRRYLERELSPSTLDMMRKLKLALDPKRILNPDKVFKIDPADKDNHLSAG
ncbi:AaceriAER321Wp [[Ashbya] aceris (nom. inval.)]|nr:AaceriAER321Wp [[Ashbya] aceris (nom. inval.)]